MSLGDGIILLAAGVVAGALGSAGGIASLISYPALLAVGLPPLSANATNLVALTTCWPGSASASRRELTGRGPWLRRWLPLTAAGGSIGAVLLLLTPPGAFARVVPLLITAGSLALIVEPWLRRLWGGHGHPAGTGRRVTLGLALGLLAVYGGFFGAGSGVLTLSVLLVLVERDLPIANALKNMAIGASTLPAGLLLVLFGPVRWEQACAVGAGALIGSRFGPAITRALPRHLTRWTVALLGLGLAVWLWIRPSA